VAAAASAVVRVLLTLFLTLLLLLLLLLVMMTVVVVVVAVVAAAELAAELAEEFLPASVRSEVLLGSRLPGFEARFRPRIPGGSGSGSAAALPGSGAQFRSKRSLRRCFAQHELYTSCAGARARRAACARRRGPFMHDPATPFWANEEEMPAGPASIEEG
jgi:hypothetical protein